MRNPFKKRVKVKFYMKSGNTIVRTFDSFECSKLSGDTKKEMSYKGEDKHFSINLDEIEYFEMEVNFNIFLTKN